MIAYKCDRCGLFYESYEPPFVIEKVAYYSRTATGDINYVPNNTVVYDLCPLCTETLEKWLTIDIYER